MSVSVAATEGVVMTGPRKGTREKAFAKRLEQACDDHPRCPEEYGRQTWIRRELAHANIIVSNETIRKWRAGETMPRRNKMSALAKMLRVDETWLAMGAQPVEHGGDHEERATALSNAIEQIKGVTKDPKVLAIIEGLTQQK